MDPNKTWLTLEDEDIERIERLAQCIRCDPLLPPPLQGVASIKLATDIEGLNLPLVHCAFKGCAWVSESLPCRRSSINEDSKILCVDKGEWSTIPCRQKIGQEVYGCCGNQDCLKHHVAAHHAQVISEMCGQEALRFESYDYYCEAVAWREQQKMPVVGTTNMRALLCKNL